MYMGVFRFLSFGFLIFVTPEGFTTMVANKGLEKAGAYLNQVPWDIQFNAPFEGSMMSLKET